MLQETFILFYVTCADGFSHHHCQLQCSDCSRTRTNYGDRSFDVYGPRVWNSLPDKLTSL